MMVSLVSLMARFPSPSMLNMSWTAQNPTLSDVIKQISRHLDGNKVQSIFSLKHPIKRQLISNYTVGKKHSTDIVLISAHSLHIPHILQSLALNPHNLTLNTYNLTLNTYNLMPTTHNIHFFLPI